MEVREIAMQRAETASPLDGVFWVVNYNEWSRGIKAETPINLYALFSLLAPSELTQIQQRVNALRNDNGYFGEKYWLGQAHNDIIDEMKRRHPGFSEDVYEHNLYLGIIAMR
jgi:hypothetical protein